MAKAKTSEAKKDVSKKKTRTTTKSTSTTKNTKSTKIAKTTKATKNVKNTKNEDSVKSLKNKKDIKEVEETKEEVEVLDQDIKALTISYSFLLSTLIIFLLSLESFKLNLFDNSVSLSIFIIPFVYFLVTIILKEIGFKPAVTATIVSIMVLVLSMFLTDLIFNFDINPLKYLGNTLAYSISQFLNISIYYYMLSNFKTPLLLVILNFIFVLLVNNMISMFFTANMIFTSTFWASYVIIICIQTLISMILAILLNLVEQGVEI